MNMKKIFVATFIIGELAMLALTSFGIKKITSIMEGNATVNNEIEAIKEVKEADNQSTDTIYDSSLELKKSTGAIISLSKAEESRNIKTQTLKSDYSDLVTRYNNVINICKENNLDENEILKQVIDEAGDILKELGNTNLKSASEKELYEINESLEIMTTTLDELDSVLSVITGKTINTSC